MKARSCRITTQKRLPGNNANTEKAELSPRIWRAWIQLNLKLVT